MFLQFLHKHHHFLFIWTCFFFHSDSDSTRTKKKSHNWKQINFKCHERGRICTNLFTKNISMNMHTRTARVANTSAGITHWITTTRFFDGCRCVFQILCPQQLKKRKKERKSQKQNVNSLIHKTAESRHYRYRVWMVSIVWFCYLNTLCLRTALSNWFLHNIRTYVRTHIPSAAYCAQPHAEKERAKNCRTHTHTFSKHSVCSDALSVKNHCEWKAE